jgi:hypothetical protein
VRVTLLPPCCGFDSLVGATIDLLLRPIGSDPNDTAPNSLRRASTILEPPSLDAPTPRFQSLLRETCGSNTDGDSNVSDFRIENREDGSARVEFRLAYARILEDITQSAKSCVEDALERMVGGGEGKRVECRMPGLESLQCSINSSRPEIGASPSVLLAYPLNSVDGPFWLALPSFSWATRHCACFQSRTLLVEETCRSRTRQRLKAGGISPLIRLDGAEGAQYQPMSRGTASLSRCYASKRTAWLTCLLLTVICGEV